MGFDETAKKKGWGRRSKESNRRATLARSKVKKKRERERERENT